MAGEIGFDEERSILVATVRSAGNSKDLARAREIHAKVASSRHGSSRFLANLLIGMYGKCGRVDDAEAVFARIRDPNLFTHNIMVSCYVRNGQIQRAEELFHRMPQKDSFSWTAMITAYGQAFQIDLAKNLFDQIPNPGTASWNALMASYAQVGHMDEVHDLFDAMPTKDLVSWNTIIAALAQKGELDHAKKIFDRMPRKNIVSWNTLIKAYGQRGELSHAKNLFDRMPQRDSTTWNTIISVYAQSGDLDRAKSILDSMPEGNDVDLSPWNTMLAVYAARGKIRESLAVFHKMPARDSTSWTNLILSYINGGDTPSALATFHQMPHKTTFHCTIILTALAQHGDITTAESVFHQITPYPDTAARNAMLSAYSLLGHLEDAQRIFDAMPSRDIISWTSMISAYAGRPEALLLFARMDLDGVAMDRVAFVAVADACSDLARGRTIHSEARAMELDREVQLGTALMTMYSRAGSLEETVLLFQSLPDRDGQCWNSMMAAYAQLGCPPQAVRLAHDMSIDGVRMDGVTLLCLLSSCSHGGFFRTGCDFFRRAATDFFVARSADHYSCMVDLLGRAGWMEQARELMDSMPFEPDDVAWTSLVTSRLTHQGSKASGRAR